MMSLKTDSRTAFAASVGENQRNSRFPFRVSANFSNNPRLLKGFACSRGIGHLYVTGRT